MADRDIIWGMYPGKHKEFGEDFEDDQLFPVAEYIGVGWPETGDLSVLGCNYAGRIKPGKDGIYKYDISSGHRNFRHLRAVTWSQTIPYSQCTKEDLAQIRTQNVFWKMKACPAKFL